MRHGWLAFALLCAACAGAVARPVLFPSANAAPTERCEWSYLVDAASPNLPEAGEAGEMGDEWKAMSAGGWRLVTGDSGAYFFQRCTSSP